jgi:hypothetical protein
MVMQILKHTPIWVFGLFFLLLYLGCAQSKTRAVSKRRLFIVPLAMVCFSVYGVRSAFGGNPLAFASWGAAIVLTLFLNRTTKQPKGVTYASDTNAVRIPGSLLPLVLMLAIFFTRYAVAASLAMKTSLRDAALFVVTASLLYGFFGGLFAARALHASRAGNKGVSGA